jgi:hypothetical protein
LRVFGKTVLRTIFGLKREEVTGELRQLYDQELRDMLPLPDFIRGMRRAGHVARIREKNNTCGVWWGSVMGG